MTKEKTKNANISAATVSQVSFSSYNPTAEILPHSQTAAAFFLFPEFMQTPNAIATPSSQITKRALIAKLTIKIRAWGW